MANWRVAVVLVALAGVTAACSVSTPRHGAAVNSGEASSGRRGSATDAITGEPGSAPGSGALGPEQLVDSDGASATATPGGDVGSPDGPASSGAPTAGTAAATGSSVGVSDDTITVAVSGPWSGPSGEISRQVSESGFGTWVDDVNARGGVHGRRVVLRYVNNHGTPEGAVAACREIHGNGSFVTGIIQQNPTLAECLEDVDIPNLGMSVPSVEPWSWVRALFLATERGRGVASFVAGPLGAADMKVGVIHLNEPTQEEVASGFVASARERGMEVVGVERVAEGQMSFAAELQRLRASGAEVVALFVLIESIGILRDARAIQYAPIFTGAVWCVDEFSLGAVDLFRGIKCLRQYTGSESPSYQEFRRMARATGHQPDTTASWAVYGYAVLLEGLLHEAGAQPTRESFMAAFESLGPIDNGVQPVMRWGPDEVVGSHAQFPVECCHEDRTWRGIGPAMEEF